MRNYFKSLSFRTKLLITFLSLTLMVSGILVLQSLYYNIKEELYDQKVKTHALKNEFTNWMLKTYAFINEDFTDTTFFKTGKSKNLVESSQIKSSILKDIHLLEQQYDQPELIKLLSNISRELENLSLLKLELKALVLQRGFKNFGIEGEMRNAVHEVEDSLSDIVNPEDFLMLRRHEKDFIIRKDLAYVEKLKDKNREIISALEKRSPQNAQNAIAKLKVYEQKFMQLVDIEKKIGWDGQPGVIYKLNQTIKEAEKDIGRMQVLVPELLHSKTKNIEFGYYSSWLIFLLVSIVGSLWMSKFFTWRIKLLSKYISDYVNSDFNYKRKLPFSQTNDEVGSLYRNFKVLQDEISVHFEHYRHKVEKRTNEILSQNNKIQEQHDKIERQRDLLDIRNREIIDSIRYAERIQRSILLKEDKLQKLFENHFIIFKPKDIVSGDFYWGRKIGKRIFFAIADCTGHGVPGAFMSIIGHNLLTYAFNDRKLREPSEVLKLLNQMIRKTLNQNSEIESMKDGMDIALFSFDTITRELKFSGAQRPLIIMRDEELIELKGNRFPVGGAMVNDDTEFSQQSIFLEEDDKIYAFSDGFVDQFGGSKNKKFKYSPFKSLLSSIHNEDEEKQKELLLETFTLWKGTNPQIDDVCVFGARL